MKLYSNTLTRDDLDNTLAQVQGMYLLSIEEIKNPKARQRGWDVDTASYTSNRKKNSGTHGAGDAYAASHDDHGNWFALLYNIDPNAKIANYNDAQDFHKKTSNRYKPSLVSGTGSVSIK